MTRRLAIVTTHPVQYYAPWFRHIAATGECELRVFYLWDFGTTKQVDRVFGKAFEWDIPLLDGYASEFVPNVSAEPGTHHFSGIDNPELDGRLNSFAPDAIVCIGYNYRTFMNLIRGPKRRREPIALRGDSHRLVERRGIKAWIKRIVLSRILRRFAGFLYVGAANRDYYIIHGVPDSKLFFATHAVDNARFAGTRPEAELAAVNWKRELGIPDGKTVILFAGKFENKKRPFDLLEAYRRLASPDAVLLLVGNGALETELRKKAAGIPGVFFAPFQNQSQMPRTYAAGDIVVLPSFGSGETWGLCVNEAMCLGRPAIVSNHVGCAQDLVIQGKTGLVFPAGDVDQLTACLRQAMQNPAARREWGSAAATHICNYSYEQATRGLIKCLNSIAPTAKVGR